MSHGPWITQKTVITQENRRRTEETGTEGDPFPSFLEIFPELIVPREQFRNRDENIVDISGKIELTKRIQIYSLESKDIVAIVAILMLNGPKCRIQMKFGEVIGVQKDKSCQKVNQPWR
jgi:hypothetical protein